MTEPTAEPATTHWDDDDDPHHDTMALLQEEIARLEAELRARDEAVPDPACYGPVAGPDESDAPLRRQVEELQAELEARDETVVLLLEQTRLFEEAAEAERAEWEQLHQWVEEVERRVDVKEADDTGLRVELEAERERCEALRRSAESDRLAWDAQRRSLERETERLRELRARPQAGGPAADVDADAAFIAMQEENRRLRASCAELGRAAAAAAEAEDLRRRFSATRAELESVRAEVRRLEDERRREAMEHEAALSALRSQLARESLAHPGEPAPAGDAPASKPSPLEADERIRAFRQHLKELHEREAQGRADRSLSSRLSRLWRHTGPA